MKALLLVFIIVLLASCDVLINKETIYTYKIKIEVNLKLKDGTDNVVQRTIYSDSSECKYILKDDGVLKFIKYNPQYTEITLFSNVSSYTVYSENIKCIDVNYKIK